MSAERWEALFRRLQIEIVGCTCADCMALGGLALFARLMAVMMRSAVQSKRWVFTHLDDAEEEVIGADMIAAPFYDALRRYHAGTDKGDLLALLCEAWGERPAKQQAACCDLAERGHRLGCKNRPHAERPDRLDPYPPMFHEADRMRDILRKEIGNATDPYCLFRDVETIEEHEPCAPKVRR